MNATPMTLTAREVARGLSIFEIDESLEALVEAAEADAEANNGEISDATKSAIAMYAEAFGYKVDRIADFLKAQRAEAEITHREAERFQCRHKAAENREKRLKQLLVWFMVSRNLPKLRGEFNTISLQGNSTAFLVIQDPSHIPASFYRARIDITWPEWIEILEAMPAGSLRERLAAGEGKFVEKDLQRGILSDALARGEVVSGVSLVKGHHVRVR
ncbi:MAG: siphovirus Gp157 family protein [Bryobacterales bacterium]|nr:siphovirus Gp157 family protein [Bryobacterales bacterium]